jgi:hypothetical protein
MTTHVGVTYWRLNADGQLAGLYGAPNRAPKTFEEALQIVDQEVHPEHRDAVFDAFQKLNAQGHRDYFAKRDDRSLS